MGNYSGTIRCGHCYTEGHNRAGCTKLTEQLKVEWEHCKSNVDPTAYRYTRVREQLAKRTGIDPVTGESKRRRRATYGGRECSYCKQGGHNRRTCDTFKTDKARFAAMTVEHRAEALASMRKLGFGPGSLIAVDDYGSKIPCLVTGITWNLMNKRQPWPTAVQARRVTDNKHCLVSFPKEISGSTGYNTVEIMSPASGVKPPAGWAEASDLDFNSVGVFNKGESRDYYFWREHDENNG